MYIGKSNGSLGQWFISSAVVVILITALTGCAAMVSSLKPDAGSDILVELKMGADPNQLDYKYVFVYSKQQIIVPQEYYYTFLPGEIFNMSDVPSDKNPTNISLSSSQDAFINYYYSNFFYTWSDYIYLNQDSGIKEQIFLDGNGSYFPSTADLNINNTYNSEKKDLGQMSWSFSSANAEYDIQFQFQLEQFGTDSAPSTDQKFYFNLFTLDPDGIVVDYYRNNNNNWTKNQINGENQYELSNNSPTSSHLGLYSIKVKII